jgi:murein DD-endopeptidase MepM/ murein hydrolase activator NlpD
MKVIIMPRDRAVHGIYSLSLGRCLFCGLALLMTVFYTGVRLQRVLDTHLAENSDGGGLFHLSAREAPSPVDKPSLDALFVQVGVLQANYQRLEILSRRVAGLAGFAAGDLQIMAEPESKEAPRVGSLTQNLARVGQQLRALKADLVEKAEQFMMFDLVLTKHAANVARQPTAMPIAPLAQLSSTYGWRRHPFDTEPSVHEGLDFAAPLGTPILAASGGVVRTAAYHGGFGNLIEIDHGDGLLTRYAHAKVLLVKKGDVVTRGQLIARVGSTGLSTGPHLHFEVRKHDKPLDPRAYLTGSPVVPASVAVDHAR